jgi:hypothetical protein
MDIRKRLSGWVALAVFATIGGAGGVMVAADPAFAKVDVDKLTIDGEARVRYEYRVGTFFGSNPAGNPPGTSGHANESAASDRVRIGVGYELTPDVSFYAQVQDARVWGTEGNCIVGGAAGSGIGAVSATNCANTGVDLHQGYIQVKNVLTPGLSLKIGRQEIVYGDHRLFGNFNWSQVGNSFDAAKIMWQSEMVDVDLFWARIIDSEVAAGCAAATASCSGVIFATANGTTGTTDQDIYGTYVTLKPLKSWTIEPYYFLLKDSRVGQGLTTGLITPQAADQARNILGTRINGKAGGLDLTLEADYQFGGINSNAAGGAGSGITGQHDLHINAEQAAGRIGYTFEAVPMKPRIGFEADYASGDSCANGPNVLTGCNAALNGHFNTADNLYPTNHFKFGAMDLVGWRNSVVYQFVFDVKPSPVSKFQVNFALDRLAKTADNWYRAGQVAYGVSLPSNQAASLGKEVDISYWHTFKEKFLFEIGYGHFWAGEYLDKSAQQNINNCGSAGCLAASTATFNGNSGQNWGYVMGSVKF